MKQKSNNAIKNWGFDLGELDTSVRPQDDFYQYANGGWLKNNPIPDDQVIWGSFYILRDKNLEDLRVILEEVAKDTDAPEGSNRQKLRDYYLEAMNEEKIEKAENSSVENELEKINGVNDVSEVTEVLTFLHKRGVNAFWTMIVDPDEKDNETEMLHLQQGGLGMPDRDYYLKTDGQSEETKKKYLQYIEKLFSLFGSSEGDAKKAGTTILDLETRLAKASMTRVECRDIEKMYNKRSVEKLEEEVPNIDWKKYFKLISMHEDDVLVAQPVFFKEVNEALKAFPIEDIKTYLRFCLMSFSAPYLSSELVDAHFEFYGKVLSGAKQMKPRWKRIIITMNELLGEMLGEPYVEKHYPPEAKQQVDEMIDNIVEAFKERLQSLKWMSDITKEKAFGKLKTFGRKVGYPKKWRDYSQLSIERVSYVDNVFTAEIFEFERMIAKLGKPVDWSEWYCAPQTVNAFYDPQKNETLFPAGILQPPLFDFHADPALNYGSVGSFIGHELTHGFDDKGSEFDEKGNYKNWWTAEDRKLFEERTKKIVEEFNSYTILDDKHVNGELTQGENIADLGGVLVALGAYRKYVEKHGRPEVLDGFTPEQRFFLGLARAERQVMRDELAYQLLTVDPHSPGELRIKGPLSNIQEFADIFDVQEGDGMYREPENRVEIW